MSRLKPRPTNSRVATQTLQVQEIVFGAPLAREGRGTDVCRFLPPARNGLAAIRTTAISQAILSHVVPAAPDQDASTSRTGSIGSIRKDITLVDVMQSLFASDGAGAMQCFGGSARLILQLEIRMKGGEMQRNVRPEMLENPFRQPARLAGVVV